MKTQLELLRQVEAALREMRVALDSGVMLECAAQHSVGVIDCTLPSIDELLRMANGVVCEMELLDFENGTKITLIAPDDSKWTAGKYLVTPQPDEGKLLQPQINTQLPVGQMASAIGIAHVVAHGRMGRQLAQP